MKYYAILFAWALILWIITYQFSLLVGHKIELFDAVWCIGIVVNAIASNILTRITYSVLDLKR